jgi:transposase-like protein
MAKGQRKAGSDKSAIIAALPKACADELAAVEFIESLRWSVTGPCCLYCGDIDVYQMTDSKTGKRNKRFLWRCRGCKKQYSVRVGTVMEESRIPLRLWAYALWKSCSSKKGMSALQIKRETGLTYKSALFMMHRIRFGMAEDWTGQPKLSGTVEADETYVGGKPRDKQARKGPRSGPDRKMPVVSLVERGGKIRSFVTADVTAANVGRILTENITRDSHLMTDSATIYRKNLGKPFARHGMTDHSRASTRSRTARIATPSNRLSRCSSAASTELSTTLAENTCIAMLWSLTSAGMLGRLMTANGWRGLCGARKASGCAIRSQSPKLRKGRNRRSYSSRN